MLPRAFFVFRVLHGNLAEWRGNPLEALGKRFLTGVGCMVAHTNRRRGAWGSVPTVTALSKPQRYLGVPDASQRDAVWSKL